MRIAFFGYQQPGYTCLKELIRSGHEVGLVVTHPDAPDETIWFGSVRDLAASRRIAVYTARAMDWEKIAGVLRKMRPELLLSVYFREPIPEEILKIPSLGAVNLHGSLLPKYRGRSPVNWAIIRGEKATGFTFHFMEKSLDSGDIILRERIPIGLRDEALDIYKKMDRKLPAALRRLLRMFASGRVERIKQDKAKATYFGGRRPDDGRIDWRKGAREIHNLVRAVTSPWPGAFSNFRGKKVFIWKSAPARSGRSGMVRAGTVKSISGKGGIGIACGSGGIIRCCELQFEGEKRVSGAIFAKRYGVKLGEKLG